MLEPALAGRPSSLARRDDPLRGERHPLAKHLRISAVLQNAQSQITECLECVIEGFCVPSAVT